MDNNLETPETSDSSEVNFGKEIAKALAISTATSAGVIAGFMVVGQAVITVKRFKDKRAAKKAAANQDATTEN